MTDGLLLFAVYPNAPPATLLGTNKGGAGFVRGVFIAPWSRR